MLRTILSSLFERGVLVTGTFVFLSLMLSTEVGYRLGQHVSTRRRRAGDDSTGISTLTTGMIGLLAFTLGLSISFAQDRFEARRNLVLTEANDIGTAWLRARLVEGPEGETIATKIEEYARTRLAFTVAGPEVDVTPLVARVNALQNEIWQPLTALARRQPTTVSVSLVQALNEMFDHATAQRFAYESQVPLTIMLGLYGGGLLAIGALGYQFGLAGARQLVLTTLLLMMWSGGMVLIVDMSLPRIGTIRTDPSPLIWTIQGFGPR